MVVCFVVEVIVLQESILVRDPSIVDLNYVEPKARRAMDVKSYVKDKLKKFHSVLNVLVHVQSSNNSS